MNLFREDGGNILSGKVTSVVGPSLVLDSVGVQHSGSYLCIASNGVPPSISKRVDLRVQCKENRLEIKNYKMLIFYSSANH